MGMRTERTLLRRWDHDDEADVRAALDIYSRMEVVEWLSRPPLVLQTETEASDRLRRWATTAAQRPGYGLWAVVPDEVGLPIGTILLVPLPGKDRVLTDDIEIGWHFHPDHWGNGYATEAARAAAILGLVGAVNLPIIHYSVVWWNSLHQGASVVTGKLAAVYLWPVLLMVLGYMAAFGALWLTGIRAEVWRRRAETLALRAARR